MFEEADFQYVNNGDILISACPVLMEETPRDVLWGYYLCIENNSDRKIQLVGKSWNITDDQGNFYADDSAGFKGELPELEPGECFEFTSTAALKAAHAVFYGSCKIVSDGCAREVKIPTFTMAAPRRRQRILN